MLLTDEMNQDDISRSPWSRDAANDGQDHLDASKVTDTTAELYVWMRCVFLTFRAIELRAMLDDTPPALRR